MWHVSTQETAAQTSRSEAASATPMSSTGRALATPGRLTSAELGVSPSRLFVACGVSWAFCDASMARGSQILAGLIRIRLPCAPLAIWYARTFVWLPPRKMTAPGFTPAFSTAAVNKAKPGEARNASKR